MITNFEYQEILSNGKLMNLTKENLSSLNERIPYCAINQILFAKHLDPSDILSLSKASLYKANPYLFYQVTRPSATTYGKKPKAADNAASENLPLIEPLQSADYFAQQNIKTDNTIDETFVAEAKKLNDIKIASLPNE